MENQVMNNEMENKKTYTTIESYIDENGRKVEKVYTFPVRDKKENDGDYEGDFYTRIDESEMLPDNYFNE